MVRQITLLNNHAGNTARARHVARELERARRGDPKRCAHCGINIDADVRMDWPRSCTGKRHSPGWVSRDEVNQLTLELIEAVKAL